MARLSVLAQQEAKEFDEPPVFDSIATGRLDFPGFFRSLLMRQMPGFRSYYLLDGGPDVLITISRLIARTKRLPPMKRRRTG